MASVLFINMFCLSDITVIPDELDWSDIPDTNVFSLSASEACFRLASWGVGGLDTEYMKSSLSSPLMEQESPLLIEKAAESGVPASKCSGLEGENIFKLINTINSGWKFWKFQCPTEEYILVIPTQPKPLPVWSLFLKAGYKRVVTGTTIKFLSNVKAGRFRFDWPKWTDWSKWKTFKGGPKYSGQTEPKRSVPFDF